MYKRKQRTPKFEEPHAGHEVEIHNYAPNVSLAPQDYALSSHLLELELNFRSTVQAFFNNTNILCLPHRMKQLRYILPKLCSRHSCGSMYHVGK